MMTPTPTPLIPVIPVTPEQVKKLATRLSDLIEDLETEMHQMRGRVAATVKHPEGWSLTFDRTGSTWGLTFTSGDHDVRRPIKQAPITIKMQVIDMLPDLLTMITVNRNKLAEQLQVVINRMEQFLGHGIVCGVKLCYSLAHWSCVMSYATCLGTSTVSTTANTERDR